MQEALGGTRLKNQLNSHKKLILKWNKKKNQNLSVNKKIKQ